MTVAAKLVVVQTKRTLREPAAVFFVIAFAPLFALLMGLIFGNDPVPEFGDRGYIDANLASITAIVVAISGLVVVPTDIVTQRETGALRRFRATPLRPLTYIAADVVVRFALSMLGIAVMFVVGILAFGAHAHGSLIAVLTASALSVLTFLAVGYALAAVLPSQGVAQGVGNVLVFPLIILSGAAVPLAVLPGGVRQGAQLSPLTQLVELLQGLWMGQTWSENSLPVLVLLGVIGLATAVAATFFRWE
ncbi:ABC-2 type transport system permease protein [Haloechinothrix alba]|uniref:Transport permease protein n=1 Tax=Haloechinothrix alba TaxID=664784 RepID=A0A238Y1Y5_9PSEU|nr:ABC transporter permease [Haloechinothrix alba]SNR64801.1 ABC-2 type transport system permease protein [Haloechinothrix alba]